MIQKCPHCDASLEEPLNLFIGVNPNAICNRCGNLLVTKEEEVIINKPKCWSYWDGRDRSCARCKISEQCKAEFEETRPTCFAQLYGQSPECEFCLDSSQCIEYQNKENNENMARKTRVRKRVKLPEAPPVEAEELEEDENYGDWNIPDLRAELKERKLEHQGRKSVLVLRLMADDKEPEEATPEPKRKPATKAKVAKVRKVVQKVVEKPAPAPPASVDVAGPSPVSDLATAIINTLQSGNTLSVTAFEGGYTLALGQVVGTVTLGTAADLYAGVEVAEIAPAPAPESKGLRGEAFWKEVLTEKYFTFYHVDAGDGVPWEEMSADDKVEFAEALDIEWEEKEDARINAMSMTRAIYVALEITKYKDEYKSPKVRKALRG